LAVNKIDMEKYIEVLVDDTNKKLSRT